jgi:glycosyltransferase involved in cell wall biosynthesis
MSCLLLTALKPYARIAVAMRILVLIPDLRTGGGVVNYYRTLRLADEPNIDYFFVNRRGTRSILTKSFWAFLIYIGFIRAAWRRRLIHVNPSLNRNSFYRDMMFILLARIIRKNVLVFFRGWEESFEESIRTSRLKSLLFRHSYAKANRFVVLGGHFKSKLLALGVDPAKPIHVETTVADSSHLHRFELSRKLQSFESHPRFLFMSRVLRQKGVYIAMDAFAECRATLADKEMILVIAGSGEELGAAQAYAQGKHYAGIEFAGEVSGAEKARLLESCHVMIFPTYYGEGLPNCVLEGMLYGMPIVSRTVAAIPEVVIHGVNGYLTDSMEGSMFASYMLQLLREPETYRRIANTNHRVARDAFTSEKVKERLFAMYRQMESP